MHVLLSNDDGLHAEGLQLLHRTLAAARPGWKLTVVAPDSEQSASSHSLTLSRPLRIEERGERQFAVTGTPTDCVLTALHGLLKDDRPDIVLSGINHGPNMGEDVHYSGTVAAAFEGRVLGLPSIALSLASKRRPYDWGSAERFVADTLPGWLERGLPENSLLNVNLPNLPAGEAKGVRVCKLGSREYHDVIVEKEDPRGKAYYWIGGDSFSFRDDDGTDFVLSARGHVTVTPLHLDATDYKSMVELEDLERDA